MVQQHKAKLPQLEFIKKVIQLYPKDIMMKQIIKVYAAATLIMLSACNNKQDSKIEYNEFSTLRLEHGVNVSHWLSQSEARGEEREKIIKKADFDSIAGMGFDFVRIPVDEVQLYDEQMNRDTTGFRLLHKAISWAMEDNLNVVVDLHIIRSHHFNFENEEKNSLFSDPKAQDKLVAIWKDMQKELSKYPTDRLAYELMNEPVAPSCEDWNRLVEKMIFAIRESEKERTLIIGSNLWQIPSTFDSLRVPENDKHIVLSFHFYEPELLTHYRAPWTEHSFYEGELCYPGRVTKDTAAIAKLNEQQKKLIESMNVEFSKDSMYAHMKPAIDKAKSLGLHLYCGEFGFYPRYISNDIKNRWYKDICSVFNEHNIANCHWCYKGDFPIVDENGCRNEVSRILTSGNK